MGDAGIEVEADLIDKYNLKDIDVLKVGHHGSKTSSSEEFINEINPKYGVISVGKNNRYGHPNDSVLDIYAGQRQDFSIAFHSFGIGYCAYADFVSDHQPVEVGAFENLERRGVLIYGKDERKKTVYHPSFGDCKLRHSLRRNMAHRKEKGRIGRGENHDEHRVYDLLAVLAVLLGHDVLDLLQFNEVGGLLKRYDVLPRQVGFFQLHARL